MGLRFTKMHGLGNDYIYVDCFHQPIPDNPHALARRISDRHFGVGGDGLILICPPEFSQHHARMRMFNADGEEAEMCGNGVRCVAKYVFDHGIASDTSLRIETPRGPLVLEIDAANGHAERVRVDMMPPILEADRIPTTLPGNPPIEVPLEVMGETFSVTCISMGNPHAIFFVDAITDDHILRLGPIIERHPAFPNRTNVEFVECVSPSELRMRVWERGSGETLACGTGACAVAVAGVLTGRSVRRVVIHLLGGDLEVEWSESDGSVYMTGPAIEVFSGEWLGSLE